MLALTMMTPREMAVHISRQAQAKRLSLNLSQKSLSEHSGVSFGVLKKFEQTGKISLSSLLKIALVLDSLEAFVDLFKLTPPQHLASLDDLLNQKTRKRGRH